MMDMLHTGIAVTIENISGGGADMWFLASK
jgi:hypothetical protein